MQAALQVQSVKKEYGYGDNTITAVNNVSFSVLKGEFAAVMGASGSGKSTLLNLIAAIDTVTDGYIIINGHNITDINETEISDFRRDYLGFIFQDYNLLDTLTLRENIALSLIIKNTAKKDIDNIVNNIAAKLEISNILDKYPYEVSGGQRQRCACARAVAVSPELILADEPTGALDSCSAKNLMETFTLINKEMNATILMVTHDAFSACYCNRILFMKDGNVVRELLKSEMNNNDFLRQILAVSAQVSGGNGYVF